MDNKNYISIISNDNLLKNAEILCSFYLKEYDSEYLIYSLNKKSLDDKTIIHVGKLKTYNLITYIYKIDDISEYNRVKEIINSINNYGLAGEIIG